MLTKLVKLKDDGEVYDVDCSDAPPHLFQHVDRKAVTVDLARIARTTSLVKKSHAVISKTYYKHLKNKPDPAAAADVSGAAVAIKSTPYHEKGHNCSCAIKGPLLLLVRKVMDNFTFDGKLVLEDMHMLKQGFCKKLSYHPTLYQFVQQSSWIGASLQQPAQSNGQCVPGVPGRIGAS